MTAERRELLRLLADVSELAPDVRLGQLIANLATQARGPEAESVWDAEDAELLAAVKELHETLAARTAAVA